MKEDALGERERHYRNLFDQANEGLTIMKLDGQLTDVNQAFSDMHGYTEMLLEDIPEDSPFKDNLEEIHTSSLRAKDLVKQILTLGGVIHVYSEPGKGTQFHVYLPVEKSLSETQVTHSTALIQGGTEQLLFVDDEEVILQMRTLMLERLGYQVTSRTSSLEALEAFRKNPDKFDMVITDMAMPNMAGDKLAIELTKIRPDIPVLLCTGFSEKMSEEKAASLGIKGFLLKPIIQIRSMLKKMLEREGFNIIVASDGKEGMKLFEKDSVDLVITYSPSS